VPPNVAMVPCREEPQCTTRPGPALRAGPHRHGVPERGAVRLAVRGRWVAAKVAQLW